ncbi:FUSC family protein [Pseudomonas matsuisoli]|uniref:Fusaric acid resistance protein n=1 Tax=Pseudomonas matsuisoli TaxID=1515666 RepID=A0A917V131_9PSED|nr:FUSC family protein [Pseudomonas matsuisoli]GGK09673.1 fusaric acid resistance protein [Pseudomonas matsuisoli]
MKGFLDGFPPGRDWFFGVRTFAASMLALYIALLMQLPRPYWAMATVYIVASPFVGPTSSKALYRAIGTLLGASAAVFLVPLFSQTPELLSIAVALWTGTMLFMSLQLRTANSYVLMLAGYTLPLIALPTVNHPETVFDVAYSRTLEILLGIVCAAVVGSLFWPRRLEPALINAADTWFKDASRYLDGCLAREADPASIGALRGSMVGTFASLEPMVGQLPHEGAHTHSVRYAQELRGRMIHLMPTADALDDALTALERRAPEQLRLIQPVLDQARAWVNAPLDEADGSWDALWLAVKRVEPGPAALSDSRLALRANALYRLGEWIDLWQDCLSLRASLLAGGTLPWRAVYRHWRLRRLSPYFDRGLMLYSAASTSVAICIASAGWILLGWTDGASAVILAAVACSFFAAMDDPAPQIYRFFFWTAVSVILAGVYLFWVLPMLSDFPMLVLAFAVPWICIGTLTAQPKFFLPTLLTLVNTASFISVQQTYDADFIGFANANLAGPVGLLFAFIWTLIARPFGAELAAKRLTHSTWRDIASLGERSTLAAHRRMGVRMLDRLMQLLPRLAQTGQDGSVALRELRVALNLLDLLAYLPRLSPGTQHEIREVIEAVGAHFRRCVAAGERLVPPDALLNTLGRAGRGLAVEQGEPGEDAALHVLHALSGLRLALMPGTEAVSPREDAEEVPYGIDGAPL